MAARRKRLAREIADEEHVRAGLGATVSLATPEALAAARIARDRLWGTARQFVLPGEAPDLDAAARLRHGRWERHGSLKASWSAATKLCVIMLFVELPPEEGGRYTRLDANWA